MPVKHNLSFEVLSILVNLFENTVSLFLKLLSLLDCLFQLGTFGTSIFVVEVEYRVFGLFSELLEGVFQLFFCFVEFLVDLFIPVLRLGVFGRLCQELVGWFFDRVFLNYF